MNQTKSGSRIVVITGTVPANENPGYRELTEKRPMARRIVVVRDGKLVGSRRGQ
jgi:hypothetical protein